MKRRLLVAGVLTILFMVVVGALRPPEGQFDTGLSREKFWLVKLGADSTQDIVLAGDSRMLCDIDPASMARIFTGKRIVNFGFNTVALTPEYLDAAAAKLGPGGLRTLVIGVTPRAFTPLNVQVSGYEEERNRPADEKFLNWHLNFLNSPMRPVFAPSAILWAMGSRNAYKDFFPNGWMPVALVPPNPREDLGVYSRIFVNNEVSPAMIDAFLRKITELSAEGVHVVGLRLPTSPELFEKEETMSGFVQSEFVSRFTAAGGTWVEAPPAGSYVITDGSHIDARDAGPYSEALARQLQPTVASFVTAR